MKINQFIDSFESMVIKFKKADSNLNLGFRIDLNEKRKKNEFIEEPKLDDFTLGEHEWKREKQPLYQNNLLLTDNIIENSLYQRDNLKKKLE